MSMPRTTSAAGRKATKKSTAAIKPAGKRTRKSVKAEATGTAASTAPEPGSQITRTFKGRELVIDVVDGKFVFEGETYSSLSALAKSIVGYGISGPHFFRMAMPKPGKLTESK